MSFIDNIKESLTEITNTEPIFRACIFGERAVYLENVSGIKSFSDQEISLFLKKGELRVCGSQLYIKKYCEGDLVVCGKIRLVERL